jgi:hypothetical protein
MIQKESCSNTIRDLKRGLDCYTVIILVSPSFTRLIGHLLLSHRRIPTAVNLPIATCRTNATSSSDQPAYLRMEALKYRFNGNKGAGGRLLGQIGVNMEFYQQIEPTVGESQ